MYVGIIGPARIGRVTRPRRDGGDRLYGEDNPLEIDEDVREVKPEDGKRTTHKPIAELTTRWCGRFSNRSGGIG